MKRKECRHLLKGGACGFQNIPPAFRYLYRGFYICQLYLQIIMEEIPEGDSAAEVSSTTKLVTYCPDSSIPTLAGSVSQRLPLENLNTNSGFRNFQSPVDHNHDCDCDHDTDHKSSNL